MQDTKIKEVVDYALGLSTKHQQKIQQIFTGEAIPVPAAFNDGDVNLSAPRLFSDSFYLTYINHMAKISLGIYGFSLAMAARSDIREYFSECLASAAELDEKAANVLLSKGLFIRPPYISAPEKVDFVKRQGYLYGILGGKRPLHATEITHIFHNTQTNALGKALLIGFSQVAKSRQIRDYFIRGKEIADKHIQVLSMILREDNLPHPMTWDSDITDSTVAPFSDRIMLYHAVLINAVGASNYGVAIGASTRADLTGTYTRLMAETVKYAGDGTDMLVKNGWMEEPPQADDRDALAKKMH